MAELAVYKHIFWEDFLNFALGNQEDGLIYVLCSQCEVSMIAYFVDTHQGSKTYLLSLRVYHTFCIQNY